MSDGVNTHETSQRTAAAPRYYVLDHSKSSVGELWRFCIRNPSRLSYVVRVLVAKLFHRLVRSGIPVLLDNAGLVDLHEIPQEIRCIIEPIIRSLESAGFKQILAVREIMAQGVGGFNVVHLSADRICWARIVAFQVSGAAKVRSEKTLAIYTSRQNGSMLCTTDNPLQLSQHPELAMERLAGATPQQLIDRHRRRVLDCADAQTISEAGFRDMIVSRLQRAYDDEIERHGFVPATSEEIQHYQDQIVLPSALYTTPSFDANRKDHRSD